MRIYLAKVRKPRTCDKCGKPIDKGAMAYNWKGRYQPMHYRHQACGRPQPSELTSSDKLSTLYSLREGLESTLGGINVDEFTQGDIESMKDSLNEAAEQAREVGEEYRESASNMEEHFPSGNPMIDEINEKADACDGWADALDQAVSTLEGLDDPDEDTDCDACEGSGSIECETCHGTGVHDCEECHGSGRADIHGSKCPICNGDGELNCEECEAGQLECDECGGTGKAIDRSSIYDEMESAVNDAIGELSL